MPIPLLSTPDKALMSTTQELMPVADITDGIVVYKQGGASLIMESTSLNFGLLSEKEQEAVIASYAGLLNSFNFPTQIVVRTQRKDITSYMRYLKEAQDKITNEKLLVLMKDYRKFILEAIKKKNVLSKRFFIVVPFTPFELGVAKSMATTLKIGGKYTPLPYPKSYVIRKAKIALYPKRDHLMRQAARMSIRLKPLSNEELIQLYFNIFNPEPPVKEKSLFGGAKNGNH
jgi:hypothetical protein